MGARVMDLGSLQVRTSEPTPEEIARHNEGLRLEHVEALRAERRALEKRIEQRRAAVAGFDIRLQAETAPLSRVWIEADRAAAVERIDHYVTTLVTIDDQIKHYSRKGVTL